MSSAAFWDKAAAKYAKDPISDMGAYIRTRDRMREVLQPHHRVLEIGCGTGSTALELADRVDSYHATDVSRNMITIAQGKLTATNLPHLRFSVSDAGSLPPGPYDAVLALNLLHLIPDLETTLSEIFNLLPPGGMLISKTALLKNGAWYLPPAIWVMRLVGKAPLVRMLGEDELHSAIQNAGFTLSETLIQQDVAPRAFIIATKPD